MFDIEKMKAKGMDPRMIEICKQINENSAKRDSCPHHDFEKGSRPGITFVRIADVKWALILWWDIGKG